MENMDSKTQLVAQLIQTASKEQVDSFSYAVPIIFSKKLASLHLIREDILYVKEAFQRLIKHRTSRLQNPEQGDEFLEQTLFFAAISQYGKCFNSNLGGHSKLEPSEIFQDNDIEPKSAHDELVQLRNSYVAHRDDTEYEQAVVLMHMPKERDNIQATFQVRSAKTFSPEDAKTNSYIELCDFLLPKIEEKIGKQAERTQTSLFKNLPIDVINQLRIN